MRSDILRHLDNYFHTLDQKILLLINNAGFHFNPKRLEKDDDEEMLDKCDNE